MIGQLRLSTIGPSCRFLLAYALLLSVYFAILSDDDYEGNDYDSDEDGFGQEDYDSDVGRDDYAPNRDATTFDPNEAGPLTR